MTWFEVSVFLLAELHIQYMHVCICMTWHLGFDRLPYFQISAVTVWDFNINNFLLATTPSPITSNWARMNFPIGRHLCFSLNSGHQPSASVSIQTAEGWGLPCGRWSVRVFSSLPTKLLKCLWLSERTCGITASLANHFSLSWKCLYPPTTARMPRKKTNRKNACNIIHHYV